MKITYEKSNNSVLIYIYLRNIDRKDISTIPALRSDLLLDSYNNWLGIEIFNIDELKREDNELSLLNSKYENIKNEKVEMYKDQLTILFDSSLEIASRIGVTANLDFNEDGIFGVELIMDNNFGKLEIIEPFLLKNK
ncbi:hypothetical protein [Sporohalobacter salinus]|uniref:hypothetical protein n=1 Tax=Sporohalobacter salinus TaxID=1494606 RepID=UPI0019614548|nr:hypothetical protein [Sporohalobacter salinus]MBM7624448.1 hypothetical protein [Sporohalobacter salinus]